LSNALVSRKFCERHTYCVGRAVVAFITAVACIFSVVGSHLLLLSSLLLLIAGVTAVFCFPAAVAFLLLLVSLSFLMFLLMPAFLQLWLP
jgi:hypothetical protein